MALVGDQQASLLGQACVRPGPAKITFGTGGMLDMVLGPDRPSFETRGDGGTFPIITWRLGGVDTWGLEAIMLAAGTNVEWLRDDLGILASSDESHEVAQQCADSGGVVYVPALLGLGTPQWDFGARGTVLGLTRGHRPARAGARGARGRRPTRRRPGRSRGHRRRASGRGAARSTAGCRATRRSCRRWPTRRRSPSRCRR